MQATNVESNPVQMAMPESPIIIVGSGPVGVRFAQELKQRSAGRSMVIFGDEPWEPYNRVKLSSVLAGDLPPSDLKLNLENYKPQTFVKHFNCPIARIDRENKCVYDDQGKAYNYSKLVLATGSRPYIPGIQGNDLRGVYKFRDMRDTEALLARTMRTRRCVVVGGGLLGLEAARAMQRGNTEVIVIQQADHLMNRQLDFRGGDRLKQKIEKLGIKIITGSGVRRIEGDINVSGVTLRDQSTIECDTVIFATGISPRVELAFQAKLKIGRGIKVNDYLQTSDPDIYAVGECAEHEGQTYGLVAPGFEQAAVAAAHLCDQPAAYHGSTTATNLKVVGENVFSAGEIAETPTRPRERHFVYENKSKGIYRKIICLGNQIIGAMALGEWEESRRIQEAITDKDRLWPWSPWRFRFTGRLWPASDTDHVSAWPETSIVCQCMGISRGQLSLAQQEHGCTSVEALSQCTQAGSVCGSCKPLLADLVGTPVEIEPVKGNSWLIYTSIAAVIMVLALLNLPSIAITQTVQHGFTIDQLWTDALYKQITGFTLLGFSVLGLLMSMRKRVTWFKWGDYPLWRVAHAILGVLSLLVLILHTGIRLGDNLNQFLMINFLLLSAIGAAAGWFAGRDTGISGNAGRRLRRFWTWMHILISWPLPALLSFHILSVYYY